MPDAFETPDRTRVPAVTADQMREVDRVAVEEVGVSLLQMMEHAGRNLAAEVTGRAASRVTVLAGNVHESSALVQPIGNLRFPRTAGTAAADCVPPATS